MKKLLILLVFGMLLICSALAIEENVAIPLGTTGPNYPTAVPLAKPTAVPLTMPTPLPEAHPGSINEYSAASMQALYADMPEDQSPSLTAEEKKRLPDILKRYEKGERPKESVLNKEGAVSLGVYALNPDDYEGEKAYALLPARTLNDDELLQLVDAFAQLKLPFGEDTLSYRNCARGGGSEASRPLTSEENARSQTLEKQYRRQELRPEQAFTNLPDDDGIGEIAVNKNDYCGMESFCFLPYRPLTDDELLRRIDYKNADKKHITMQQYAEYERKTRDELQRVLNMPLSMDLLQEEITNTRNQADFLSEAPAYSVHFGKPDKDGTEYFALLNTETGKVVWSLVMPEIGHETLYSDLHLDPFDTKWQDIAKQYVAGIRTDGVPVKAVVPRGEMSAQGAGYGAAVDVQMEDGSEYHLVVPYQTEKVSPHVEYVGQPPLNDTAADY